MRGVRWPALLILCGALAAGTAAAGPRVWTRPSLPDRNSLDRLNLNLAWRVTIPMDGMRDGLASVQNIGGQVIVQTLHGRIVCLDGATGRLRWMNSVGQWLIVPREVGFNDHLVLVANGTQVFGLDRADGSVRWEVDLPASPSSAPAADNIAFYINLSNGRLASYLLPDAPEYIKLVPVAEKSAAGMFGPVDRPGVAKPDPRVAAARSVNAAPARAPAGGAGRTVTASTAFDDRSATVAVRTVGGRTAVGGIDIKKAFSTLASTHAPLLLWDYQTTHRVQERPVIGSREVLVATTDNLAILVRRIDGGNPIEIPTPASISAPMGQYGDRAYLAEADGVVQAVDLDRGVFLWRYIANGAVTTMPQATDDDLYVVSDLGGLIRLDREYGTRIWQNPTAFRYVAINPKFVYAADRHGRLLILDRRRGFTLGQLDTQCFNFPVQNETTDRVLLAAHDGTIICLHDKAYPDPLPVQTEGAKAAIPAATPVTPAPQPVKPPPGQPAAPPAGAMEK